jgi:hypothetical protein
MSKEAKHTPGPWWLNYNGHYWDVKTRRDKDPIDIEPYEYGVTIASTISDQHEKRTAGKETEEANARLIAAAPDMFKVLTDLIYLSEGKYPGLKFPAEDQSEEAQSEILDVLNTIMVEAKEAIAKANNLKP